MNHNISITKSRLASMFAVGLLLLLDQLGLAEKVSSDTSIKFVPQKMRAAAEDYRQRAYPLGTIPAGAREQALQQIRALEISREQTPAGLGVYTWQALGPAPIKDLSHGTATGRVTALAVDPSNEFHWLIGAAQGGIWETTDAGATWTARTDDQASLAMGAIAFAPSQPATVYAGTGEPNFSGDSYAGAGLLVSFNGGTNWQMQNSQFAQSSFSSIQVNPTDKFFLSVATVRGIAGKVGHGSAIPPNAPPRGVFVSDNGGALFGQVLNGEATALAMDPYSYNRQYAGLGEIFGDPTNGVYRTTNHWTTHELIQGPWTTLSTPTAIGRIAIAIAPLTSQVAYVGVSASADIGGLVGVFMTTNAWAAVPNWTQLPGPSVGGFSWYSFALAVDPNDYQTVYMAEEHVQRCTSGFWSDLGKFIHADQHVMAWVPWPGIDNPRLLLGNDGGVFFSSQPPSSSWSALTGGGLSISQTYKGSVHPKPANKLILAGTQDNGTVQNQGDKSWNQIQDADGSDNAISVTRPDTDWATSFETLGSLNLYRTQDAGTNFEWAALGIDSTDAPFFVHFEKNQHNDDLLIAGTVQLWRCTNFFSLTNSPSWDSNGPVMLGNGGSVAISAMAFANSDVSGQTYAFGTADGQLRITSDGGGHWSDLDPTNGVPGRFITGLAFSPANANVVLVTVSGFDEGTPGQPGHVFRTDNALAAQPGWRDVSPPVNLPMNCLAINPLNANEVFVGSDIGVWRSTVGGGSWVHHGPAIGMPNVAVYDLKMDNAGEVTAFTHGRGVFAYRDTIPDIVVAGPVFPIDFACLVCPPVNWLNPGDRVTVEFGLQNILPFDTIDLTATMLPSANVAPLSGTQHYGVIGGQGAAVKRAFSFRAMLAAPGEQEPAVNPGGGGVQPKDATTCGDTMQVVFQLQDQGLDLGQVSFPFKMGVPRHALSEDFETVPPPLLPPGWDTATVGAGTRWLTTSNTPSRISLAAPDDVEDLPAGAEAEDNVGAFASVPLSRGQSYLYTPVFVVTGGRAELRFRQAFEVTTAFDGCVLEISLGGQPFQDFVQAGGSFSMNGYNTRLNDRNPLALRAAWSGNSGGWTPVIAQMPTPPTGLPMQLRWNFAYASGHTNGVWYVDSVAVTEAQCLPAVTNPVILNPRFIGGNLLFDIQTVSSRTYYIESKTNLNDPTWTQLQTLTGDGTTQTVSVPANAVGIGFFRFRVD